MRDQIGQVVLALRVLRRDAAKRVEQRRQVEGVDAAVDFLDLPFRRARRRAPRRSGRCGRSSGRSGRSRTARSTMAVTTVAAASAPGGFRRAGGGSSRVKQRDVTRQEDHRALPAGEQRLGLLQGVGGSELRFLNGEPNIGLLPVIAGRIGAVADDERDGGWDQGLRRLEHMLDHWLPGDRVQHFRQRGLHPRALAGGENDDMDVGIGRPHLWSYDQYSWLPLYGGIDRPSTARPSTFCRNCADSLTTLTMPAIAVISTEFIQPFAIVRAAIVDVLRRFLGAGPTTTVNSPRVRERIDELRGSASEELLMEPLSTRAPTTIGRSPNNTATLPHRSLDPMRRLEKVEKV